MLISFSIKNWKSFRDEAVFSLVASREKQMKDTLSFSKKYKIHILPITALYGANASGKSAFFSAFIFAERFILSGSKPENKIPTQPFLLDEHFAKEPSSFKFVLLLNESMYEYSFTVSHEKVVEEKLTLILTTRNKPLFERSHNNGSGSHIKVFVKGKNKKLLDYAKKTTRDNQLFLTTSVYQNIDEFKPIYDWFKYKLQLISPDAKYQAVTDFLQDEMNIKLNGLLHDLDTGINRLTSVEVPIEQLSLPETIRSRVNEIKEDGVLTIQHPDGNRSITQFENGELTSKKLVTVHKLADGEDCKFDLSMESDGTNRIIDLAPAFIDLCEKNTGMLIIIDEFDRSLHTLLTKHLIEMYLENCNGDNLNQLFFTTHDVMLMDQNLLRRDEMWVVERDEMGNSTLIPFSDYKDVRNDKDIRKSYLQGNLGGVPRLLIRNLCHKVQKQD